MYPTTTIHPSYTDTHLRLQAPTLTAGAVHASPVPSVQGDVITWEARAGTVRLTARSCAGRRG